MPQDELARLGAPAVGEKVWAREQYGWNGSRYRRGVVTKVTATGLTDVSLEKDGGEGSFNKRFSPRPSIMGGDWPIHGERWRSNLWLDREMSFADRDIFVRKQTKLLAASAIITKIEIRVRGEETAESLLEIIADVRSKIDRAAALVAEAETISSERNADVR